MLDLDWMKDALKEAIEGEDWDLVREVIAYLSDDDVFQQYKEDEDWWSGAGEKDEIWGGNGFDRCYLTIKCSRV